MEDESRPSSKESDNDFGERRTEGTKPGTGDAQDVFLLTGTTFAGATDMNSTAGPNDTRPSTEGWTRPNTSLQIARIGEEDDSSVSSTARHNKLLIEAELRAEHQQAARTTMLDLARALDQSNSRSRELAALLRTEYEASSALRSQRDDLEAQVNFHLDMEEKRQADNLVEKALKSGNKMFFNMLIEKSREVYECDMFEGQVKPDPDDAAAVSRPPLRGDKGVAVGDMVTFSWILKLWCKEVELTKIRLAKEREEEEKRLKAEEEARRMEEIKRQAVEEVKKVVRELEISLDRARTIIEEQKTVQEKVERELRETKTAATEAAQAAKVREEVLQIELTQTQSTLGETRKSLAQISVQYEAAQEALRKADEAFAAERSSLHRVIRQVNSELHEAMVLAKHMRETALKAKRDAAGSVSPSKFAELIGQLEAMKNSLAMLAKDCMHEKDTNAWLGRQLDKNKRTLELERQFLPLLRKVRGPVGPKIGKATGDAGPVRSKDMTQLAAPAAQGQMPPLNGGASPNKMRMSQSMGALSDGRAATAGGPLAGGRSHGGFMDEQSRFASSMGFASSGQGTPARG